MSITAEKREAVRVAYSYCCGYCGITEINAGNALDIDHYQPVKYGGNDALDNLVYVCPACNRFKGEYWPKEDDPDSFRLLHPNESDLSAHIVLTTTGRLAGLTPRGWFHIQWLHLNRPQLVAWRQRQRYEAEVQEALAQAEITQRQLRNRIRALEQEIAELQEIITRLL